MVYADVRGRGGHAGPASRERGYRCLGDDWGASETLNLSGRVKDRAFYCNTDSVILLQEAGQPPAVTCGDKLDNMSSDLGLNMFIEEFVSRVHKKYVYKPMNTRS